MEEEKYEKWENKEIFADKTQKDGKAKKKKNYPFLYLQQLNYESSCKQSFLVLNNNRVERNMNYNRE